MTFGKPVATRRLRVSVWGSDCVRCGNTNPDSDRCEMCGSADATVPLYYDEQTWVEMNRRLRPPAPPLEATDG